MQATGNPALPLQPDTEHEALREIEDYLLALSKSLSDFPAMPIPPPRTFSSPMSRLEFEEMGYDRSALAAEVALNLPKLNPEQRDAVNKILEAVASSDPVCLMLNQGFRIPPCLCLLAHPAS